LAANPQRPQKAAENLHSARNGFHSNSNSNSNGQLAPLKRFVHIVAAAEEAKPSKRTTIDRGFVGRLLAHAVDQPAYKLRV